MEFKFKLHTLQREIASEAGPLFQDGGRTSNEEASMLLGVADPVTHSDHRFLFVHGLRRFLLWATRGGAPVPIAFGQD